MRLPVTSLSPIKMRALDPFENTPMPSVTELLLSVIRLWNRLICALPLVASRVEQLFETLAAAPLLVATTPHPLPTISVFWIVAVAFPATEDGATMTPLPPLLKI